MSKRKDGVFSLLRQILAEQKKQTKILQAIGSRQEPNPVVSVDAKKMAKSISAQSGSTFKTSFKIE